MSDEPKRVHALFCRHLAFCQRRGFCVQLGEEEFCQCHTGYEGPKCERKVIDIDTGKKKLGTILMGTTVIGSSQVWTTSNPNVPGVNATMTTAPRAVPTNVYGTIARIDNTNSVIKKIMTASGTAKIPQITTSITPITTTTAAAIVDTLSTTEAPTTAVIVYNEVTNNYAMINLGFVVIIVVLIGVIIYLTFGRGKQTAPPSPVKWDAETAQQFDDAEENEYDSIPVTVDPIYEANKAWYRTI